MEPLIVIVVVVFALLGGLALGWFAGNRTGKAGQETTTQLRAMLDQVVAERDSAKDRLARLETSLEERERSFAEQIAALGDAKENLSAQFGEIGQKLLGEAQAAFLQRADERFHQAGEKNEERLKQLLGPVGEKLKAYEEQVGKIEKDRTEAYGDLKGLIGEMRLGQERVSSVASGLMNSLRNAPKARGRWGEQQLRNVLESCGLAEHADFMTEVSVADGEGGRLRPDVIVKVPGGKSLVIDAKVSLNAYQDAFGAVDEQEREVQLAAHAAAMKAHVNTLGNKAYWSQFPDAPDYVIMFVPGEHFLTAALEQDHQLWDYAFDRKVLLATPTNLIAIARTVAAVWKQETMAGQAREIAELGRELYSRLATMGGHVGRMGRNLDTAVSAYNAMVGSLESQVMTSAQRFEKLGVDTGAKAIETLPIVEQAARPLAKLAPPSAESSD